MPSDVGVTIGVGVVAATPTVVYSGPTTISIDGTTIENVIVNSDLLIRASNVTIRNIIMNDPGNERPFFIGHWDDPDIDNLVIEYSTIDSNGGGKIFNINNATNVTIRNNEVSGGQDWNFINRSVDGFLSENNYFHTVIGDAGSHVDGYQLGEFGVTTGTLTIRGNYFVVDNAAIGKTDLLNSSGDSISNQSIVVMENNFITPFGYYTLRCHDSEACHIRNNVYAQEFKTAFSGDPDISRAAIFTDAAPLSTHRCNRYEDGDFMEQQYVIGVTHDITSCPSYP